MLVAKPTNTRRSQCSPWTTSRGEACSDQTTIGLGECAMTMPDDDHDAGRSSGDGATAPVRSLRSGEPRIAGRLVAALSEGLGLTLVANWFYLPLAGPDSTWGHLALTAFGGVVVLAGVVAHRGDTPWLATPFPLVGLALLATTPGLGVGTLSVTMWANVAAVATIGSLPLVWYLWQTASRRHRERKRV